MSKEDIEKAVREAEQYAEEDKKRREEVETRNQADSLVYQTDKVLKDLEDAGAAAVGFNCVAADMMTPYLITKLRRSVRGPLICKPNAGVPTIGADGIPYYPQTPEEFVSIVMDCHKNGATVLGGCCGTAPEFIAAVKNALK